MNKLLNDLASQYAYLYWQTEASEREAMETQARLNEAQAQAIEHRYKLAVIAEKIHKASA